MEQEEQYSEYKLDFIFAETRKSYYGIIDGLTIDPKWIPKSMIGKNFRVKKWYIELIKEGRTLTEPKEKKMKQVKLTNFVTMF